MTYLKKLGISLLFILIPLLLLSFLLTIFYYFDIISTQIYNILKLIIPLFSFFLGSYIFGKKASKRGFLEGLKLGAIMIILFLIGGSLLGNDFKIKTMFYSAILLLTSSLGGMIGINRNDKSN